VSWVGSYVHTKLHHVTSGPTSTFASADKFVTLYAIRQVTRQNLIYTWALRAPCGYSSQHRISRSNSPLLLSKLPWNLLQSGSKVCYLCTETSTVKLTLNQSVKQLPVLQFEHVTEWRTVTFNQTSGALNSCVDVWRTLRRFVTVTINSE